MHVALTTFSAFCDYKAIVFLSKIAKQFPGISVSHLGAHRNQQSAIITAFASLLFAAAMCSPGRFEVTLEMEIKEGLFGSCGSNHHITALAAIPTIRTTPWHILFSSETNTSSATVTGPNVDLNLIDKTHGQRWCETSRA
jgi:hypothetical protein